MLDMTLSPWGPLGNPTKEQIEHWWNLPYGEFTNLKNLATRKRKGKTQTEFTVYAMKKEIKTYYVPIKVMAYDRKDAIAIADRAIGPRNDLDYSDAPFAEDINYGLTTWSPGTLSKDFT